MFSVNLLPPVKPNYKKWLFLLAMVLGLTTALAGWHYNKQHSLPQVIKQQPIAVKQVRAAQVDNTDNSCAELELAYLVSGVIVTGRNSLALIEHKQSKRLSWLGLGQELAARVRLTAIELDGVELRGQACRLNLPFAQPAEEVSG